MNHKHYDSLGVIKSGLRADIIHGTFTALNVSDATTQPSFTGTFGFINATNSHVSRGQFFISRTPVLSILIPLSPGCYREPDWPWYRQPFPWWTMFFLVPLYSTCSSLSNLQSFRSYRLPIMIIFSCCSYTANKASNMFLADKGALAPAAGALVIGLLGNIYSRWSRGTAFTSMVTGVLFLVPVRNYTFLIKAPELWKTHLAVCLVWSRPSWWSHWKLRQLRATVLQQLYTRSAHDSGCDWRYDWPLCQPKSHICTQCQE